MSKMVFKVGEKVVAIPYESSLCEAMILRHKKKTIAKIPVLNKL